MDFLINNNLYDIIPKNKVNTYLKNNQIEKPNNFNDLYNKSSISEIYKNNKYKNFKKIVAPPFSFNVDIMHMPPYQNKQYLLTFIDLKSRMSFLYPLKNKSMNEIIKIFKLFYESLKTKNILINSISSDSEFNNKLIIDFCNNNNIKYYFFVAKDEHITKNSNPLGIIDRFTRTFKSMMEKFLFKMNSNNWPKYVDLVNNIYNNLPHKSLNNLSPVKIFYSNDTKQTIKKPIKSQFKVFDYVRIKIPKNVFDKEGKNYFNELYRIDEIKNNKFVLINSNFETLKRTYKEAELIKSKHTTF